MLRCKDCGGPLILTDNSEYVCERCGLVHTRRFYVEEELPVRKVSGDIFMDGLEYGSTFNYKDTRSTLRKSFERLGRASLYAKMTGRRVMELHALRSLKIASTSLGIPLHIQKRAVYLYLMFSRRIERERMRLLGPRRKVNHYRLAAVSLLIACREANYNVNERELVKRFKAQGHRVSLGGILEGFWLARQLGILDGKCEIESKIKRYILMLLKSSNGCYDNHVLKRCERLAIKILKKVKKEKIFQGRRSSTVAAAIAYLSLKILCKEGLVSGISLHKAAKVCGHSISCIRNNVRILEQRIKVSSLGEKTVLIART